MPRLEVFHFRQFDLRAEEHILEVFDDFEISQLLERDDVEQPIIHDSVLEKGKRTTVAAPVADQHKRSFPDRIVFRLNDQARRLTRRNLSGRDKVAERSEIALQGRARLLDDLGIESDAGELDKMFSIRARKIDKARVAAFDDLPAKLEIMRRKAELHREHVSCSHRQQTERGATASQTIYDFVNGAIAAGSHDLFETLVGRSPRQCFGFATMSGAAGSAIARQRLHLSAPAFRAFAVRGGVENDDGVIHRREIRERALIFSPWSA